MSRVIALVACGFTVAACSASVPSLNFLSSSPPSEALRFESEPQGAEVKTSGQTCRTPCELTVQVAPEMSATFALNGYQPQTISVRSEASGGLAGPRLAPNPVRVELRPVPVAPPAKKRVKKKTPVAAARAKSAVASAAPTAARRGPAEVLVGGKPCSRSYHSVAMSSEVQRISISSCVGARSTIVPSYSPMSLSFDITKLSYEFRSMISEKDLLLEIERSFRRLAELEEWQSTIDQGKKQYERPFAFFEMFRGR
jgi:hypothetical protein